ncbi:MAG: NifU family protein [Rhodospirillaceae bacterium]|nr:NifU family protein [Rhodospirillaceae bacterium]
MFIQTEQTPNPQTLKFLPNQKVTGKEGVDYPKSQQAAGSPLASRLFKIEGVEGVFLGNDFVTITKNPKKDWQILKPALLGAMMDHFTSGQPAIQTMEAKVLGVVEDDEITAKIKELLETRVRPAVAQDGGDIVFADFKDGTVYVHLRGSCAGCPSSTATLKVGIENMLRHYVPEVKQVKAV